MTTMSRTRKAAKYFTRQLLCEAAEKGEGWDYNRQLDPQAVATLPDLKFPVMHTLPHHHRAGEPCEEHMRCVVYVCRTPDDPAAGEHVVVDVPLDFYERLPVARIR